MYFEYFARLRLNWHSILTIDAMWIILITRIKIVIDPIELAKLAAVEEDRDRDW